MKKKIEDPTRRKLFPTNFFPKALAPKEKNLGGGESVATAFSKEAPSREPLPNLPGGERSPGSLEANALENRALVDLENGALAAEFELLIRTLNEETKVQNYSQAATLSSRLQELLAESKHCISADVWIKATLALWEFEKYSFERSKSGNLNPDTAKLNSILQSIRDRTSIRKGLVDLVVLEARITAFDGKPDVALDILGKRDDDEGLYTRMAILVEEGRFAEASALIRGREPHQRWCEKAVSALAGTGDLAEAKRQLEWAHKQSDPFLWSSCVVALGAHYFLYIFRNLTPTQSVLPENLNEAEKAGVKEALSQVSLVSDAAKIQKRVLTGIETAAISLAMEFHHLLGEHNEYRELSELVWNRSPLPLPYAFAVLRKVIPPHPELPKRLREERPESFEAKRLAALIEGKLLGKNNDAILNAKRLLEEFSSPNYQEIIAQLLIELSQELPLTEKKVIDDFVDRLLGSSSQFSKFRKIERLLVANRFGEAERLLLKDPKIKDPAWLEFMSAIRNDQGRVDEAVDLLIQATDFLPNPDLLRKAAFFAAKNDRQTDSIRLLERLLRIEPQDAQALESLANFLTQSGEFLQAAKRFHELSELRPDDPLPAINEAVSLAHGLRHEESLKVYQSLCAQNTPPIRALLGLGTLLKLLNRAADGFNAIDKHKTAFWNNADFLLLYWELGYAANREREANEALQHLQVLQEQGTVEKVLHSVEVPELLASFQQLGKAQEVLGEKILNGQIPWLLAGQMLSMPTVLAFHRRTRQMPWISENKRDWSWHNLYATNAFVVAKSDNGLNYIQPIQAAEREREIVIDLTSLFVLHKIGLLNKVCSYFAKCYYPADYNDLSLRELGRLVDPQPSRTEGKERIKSLIESGQIKSIENSDGIALVNEYYNSGEARDRHVYSFIDLVPGLKEAGILDDRIFRELSDLAQRPSGVDSMNPAIPANAPVHIELSCLEALHTHHILSAALSSFQICVTNLEIDRLNNDIQNNNSQKNLMEWYRSLWNEIDGCSGLVAIAHSLPNEVSKNKATEMDDVEVRRRLIPMAATFLARNRNLPLFVDDRSCQMAVHRENKSICAAFGTEAVLGDLVKKNFILPERAADAYMELIKLRYRFMVVPADVMIAMAKKNLLSIPGASLQEVARYVQRCMSDPGLFSGIENADPPISVALKFFLAWTSEVTKFVHGLWDDIAVSLEEAENITSWALTECLPSVPASIGNNSGILLTKQTEAILSQSFIYAASRASNDRICKFFIAIRKILNVSECKYFDEMLSVINAI